MSILPAAKAPRNDAAARATARKLFEDLLRDLTRRMWVHTAHTLTVNLLLWGGNSTLETTVYSAAEVPAPCEVVGWSIREIGENTSSIVVDIQAADDINDTSWTSIAGSDKPTLSSATKASSTALTGWTTRLERGSFVRASVDSATGAKKVLVSLEVRRLDSLLILPLPGWAR